MNAATTLGFVGGPAIGGLLFLLPGTPLALAVALALALALALAPALVIALALAVVIAQQAPCT